VLKVKQKYEIVPRAAAIGYRNVTTAWIDVAGCGGTTTFSPAEGIWQLESQWWPSSVNGEILFAQGHVHEVTILHFVEKIDTHVTVGRNKFYIIY
jgi:hypothetical protein